MPTLWHQIVFQRTSATSCEKGARERLMPASTIELQQLIEHIQSVHSPEALFGATPFAQQNHRRLLRFAHPDGNPENKELATKALAMINDWWEKADERIKAGLYGSTTPTSTPIVLQSKRGSYQIGALAFKGDLADLYWTNTGLLVKIGRAPADNDLLTAEASNLRKIREAIDAKDTRGEYLPFFPELIDSFRVKLDHGIAVANVLKTPSGLYSLRQVHEQKDDLDPRDFIWMYRRLLKVLGFLHHKVGLVHGAVNIDHVLIHPDHGLTLVDWCYAVPANTVLKAVPGSHQLDYNGVELKNPVTPSLDIYLASHVVALYMLGSGSIPVRLRRFFDSWRVAGPHQVQDAWTLLKEFDDLAFDLYPRTYRPFSMD